MPAEPPRQALSLHVLLRVGQLWLGLLCALWLGAGLHWGWHGWGLWGPVLWLLTLNAQALALEQVCAAWVHGADPTPRPSVVQRGQAWWAEVRRSTWAFGWAMPWAHHAWPDRLPERSVSGQEQPRRGVLLIHGYVCNRGFWNRWYPLLQARGVPCVGLSLVPVFGSIDAYADAIDSAITRLQHTTGAAPLVVCHSMGGLALRAWRRAQRERGVAAQAVDSRVHHVVTLGTPHQGTWLARFGSKPNAVQMRPGSPWLQQLAASEDAAWQARFTCVYSDCDNVVFPPRCAVLPRAAVQYLPGRAHQDLVEAPEVFAQVLTLLADPATSRPPASFPKV